LSPGIRRQVSVARGPIVWNTSGMATPQRAQESPMADLYLKALESERKALWATCRLKGLARDTPERQRIAALDEAIAAHRARKPG
jgi:hypothetical protein